MTCTNRYTSLNSDIGDDNWTIPPFIDSFLQTVYTTPSDRVSTGYIFIKYKQFIETLDTAKSIRTLAVSESSRMSLARYLQGLKDLRGWSDDTGKVITPRQWSRNKFPLSCLGNADYWNLVCLDPPGRGANTQLLLSPEKFFESVNSSNWEPPFSREFKSKTHGHVAVASRDLCRSEIICEYRGSLTTEAILKKRERDIYGMNTVLYPQASYLKIRKGYVWDAYRLPDGRAIDIRQNFGAWLNSADKPSNGYSIMSHDTENNCRVMRHPPTDAGGATPRLYVVTIKAVPRSFELLHDYNSAAWWVG